VRVLEVVEVRVHILVSWSYVWHEFLPYWLSRTHTVNQSFLGNKFFQLDNLILYLLDHVLNPILCSAQPSEHIIGCLVGYILADIGWDASRTNCIDDLDVLVPVAWDSV